MPVSQRRSAFRHLQDIRHSAQEMAGLMEEVLLLGRVESGRMQCKPEKFDLPGFCQRLIDEQLSATGRKCPIQLSLEHCDQPAEADEGLLRHVFNNLLSNAVKYSPAGKAVQLVVRREGQEAIFEVRDQGIGIPSADQRRIFSAFHRGSNVGEIPGTGLGLVIVKRCVELHGGSIEITSESAKGTVAAVRLKLFFEKPPIGKAKKGRKRDSQPCQG